MKIGSKLNVVGGAGDGYRPGSSYFDNYGAFYGCTALKELDLGSVTEIATGAFYGCSGLETVTIPDSVVTIKPYAFANCTSLVKATIGKNLTTLGGNAFSGDKYLHYLEFTGAAAPSSVGSGVFSDTNTRVTSYVAEGSTGWTELHQPGLPESGTWAGAAIAYAPAPADAVNPYDFYTATPTDWVYGQGGNHTWSAPILVTTSPYVNGSTVPTGLAEIYEESPIYVSFAFDEFWRGKAFSGLETLVTLRGESGELMSTNFMKTVDGTAYSYLAMTNLVYAELQKLPVGEYMLTMTINPDRTLAETTYTNNATYVTFKVIELPVMTATFDANGGTVEPATIGRKRGKAIGELPVASRDGYVFAGWYTRASGGTRITPATALAADVTYYAHWSSIPCGYDAAIMYDAANGSGTLMYRTVVTGKVVKLDAIMYENEGKTFKGWLGSNGKRYDDQMLVFDVPTKGKTLVLTAIWE